MTANRYRSAWIWVAVAAMAVASLARVQAGIENATAYTNPVLEFLAGYQDAAAADATGASHAVHFGSAGKGSAHYLQSGVSGAWTAILPVLFIGLVAPLSLISARSIRSLGRTPAAPSLPSKFQRPPPSFFV